MTDKQDLRPGERKALSLRATIERLGGAVGVAKALDVTEKLVEGWIKGANVTKKHRTALGQAASNAGFTLAKDEDAKDGGATDGNADTKSAAPTGGEPPAPAKPAPAKPAPAKPAPAKPAPAKPSAAQPRESVVNPPPHGAAAPPPPGVTPPGVTTPGAAPPAPARGGGVVAGVAWLALVVAVAVAALVAWGEFLGGGEDDAARFAPVAAVAAIDGRLATIEAKTQGDLASAQQVSVLQGGLAAVTERLTALGDQLSTTQASLDALNAKLTAIEARTAALEAAAGDGGLQAQVAKLAGDMQAMRANIDALANDGSALATLGDRVDALEAAVDKRLATVQDAIAAAGAARDEAVHRATQALALTLSSIKLREAIDAGQPLAAQIAALKSLDATGAPGAPDLSALEAVAESGVATVAELRASFEGAAEAIDIAANTEEDAGVLGRAIGRAAAVISVRRIGEDGGDDAPESLTARADRLLGEGKVAEAVAELEKLDPKFLARESLAPARAWLEKAHARLAALAVVEGLDQAAMALLKDAGGQ